MDLAKFNTAFNRLGDQALEDVAWSETVGEPNDAEDFALEAIYVICNSGMRFTVARGIYDRIVPVLKAGRSSREVFGHAGKCGAIDDIWARRELLYDEFLCVPDDCRVEWLGGLPWIGEITKFHLAKNFGVDCVKPDVHLARLATALGTDPDTLCADLAKATGFRKATIDLILWRACATGVMDSHTGAILPPPAPEPEQQALAI